METDNLEILKCHSCGYVFEWNVNLDGWCSKCRNRFHWHGKEIIWLSELKEIYKRLYYDEKMAVELFDCLYIEPECTLDENCWCEDCKNAKIH